MRVLLVDDDRAFLDELRAQLHGLVGGVLTASSPLEAIWMLEQNPVDAVIADLMLGRGAGDGLKLLDIVRRRWPRAARILVTGQDLGDRVPAPSAHAVLVKPCPVSQLIDALRAPHAAGSGRHPAAADAPEALRWQITRSPAGDFHIVLAGEITEASSFADIDADSGTIVLDFAGVERINSHGVGRLRRFLGGLHGCRLEAVSCSPALVAQLTLIPSLASLLHVRSVLVPFDCPQCDTTADSLVEVPAAGGLPALPDLACLDCGVTMEPASPPHIYFAFLTPPSG
jgi:CheY-like chemotaxis protein